MMVERVGIIQNMEDEELEMLLGEIPHATSSLSLHPHPSYANAHHHHHHHHVVNGNPHGNPSFITPTTNRITYGMYDGDSSCSYNQNTHISPAPSFSSMFSNAHSSSDTSSSSLPTLHDPTTNPHIISRSPGENLVDELGRMYINQDRTNSTRFGASDDYLAINPHFPTTPMNPDIEFHPAFFGFQQNCALIPPLQPSNFDRSVNYCYQWGVPAQFGVKPMDKMIIGGPYMTRPKGKSNTNHGAHRFHHMAAGGSPDTRTTRGGLSASDDSLIIQGEDLNRIKSKSFVSPCENGQTKVYLSCSSPLTEAQRYIFLMAKDQHGCRLLQKIFDDGNSQHVQIVFNEIIGHVVELMINPFGNYLMQKLLEVCNEEQRMHILMSITREPRELVQISLNTHGTRVVQKLIETLKTRQQVKLVISALEPGFLALIKDLNGNHVIQRCLQCLSNEDNKFIFEAAAKYCVDIATHQHGCCVLQRCINHSTGEHREKLVSEISANGLLLAQDAFGNYVVQYILELQIPSAVSKLISQFEGNFVHLATQKFSSHVVEKCLAVLDGQIRSTIIRELISATHFEQVLQDPHANYVVQTALRVAEGPLHNALVSAIESHKAISRNSPYSKRIFSHKLLRR